MHRRLFLLLLPLLAAGCATAPAPVADAGPPGRLSPEQARDATVYALGLVGTPYRWGGNTPESGFDCSGLIAHVLQRTAGLASPRTTAALQSWGAEGGPATLRSGDLVIFGAGRQVTHAGIFVGEDRFVHAPSSGGQVRLDRLSAPYWSRRLMAVRRP